MSENKRYYSVDYDEEYYIFDSHKISQKEVEEKAEYSYDVFADSLTSKEILELLNENEELKEIFIEQLETALTLPFIRKEYCNALLRILDEEDSVESAKQYVIDVLGDSE